MTGYVLKGGAREWYVARPGIPSGGSYTPKLEEARIFPTREQAAREKCGNERVLALEEVLR